MGFVIGVSLAVVTPILSLMGIALRGDAAIWAHLAAYVLPTALVETALLLCGIALVTAIVGIGTAWIVTAYRFPGRGALAWLLPLPLALPTYIIAYVYVDVLDTLGPAQGAIRTLFGLEQRNLPWFPNVRSLGGAIAVMSLVLYPYVYLSARAMFQTQSASLIEVARTLGARRLALARHVALPLARPALAVGLSLALLEALNDIGASEYLGVQTLTLSIFTTWLNRGSLPGAAQIACFMLAVIIGLMALEAYGRRDKRFTLPVRRPRVAAPIPLNGGWGLAAGAACWLPVIAGFVIPVVFLGHEVIRRGLLVGFDPALARHTLTSVGLAGVATMVTLALGLGLVVAARMLKRRLADYCLSVAGLGYAVPGTVLALGLLAPLVGFDEALNAVSRLVGGPALGLVVAGSAAAVIVAYVIRFLAVAIGSLQAGMSRISTHVDDAARTLGSRPAEIARLIHLPLARPALGGAALLVFVDTMKELPATLLLRPLNVETLPTYIYQFATRGAFEEGALAALLIVAVGLLPVMRLTRFADTAPEDDSSRRDG